LDSGKEEMEEVMLWSIEGTLIGGSSGNGTEGFQDEGWQGSYILKIMFKILKSF